MVMYEGEACKNHDVYWQSLHVLHCADYQIQFNKVGHLHCFKPRQHVKFEIDLKTITTISIQQESVLYPKWHYHMLISLQRTLKSV